MTQRRRRTVVGLVLGWLLTLALGACAPAAAPADPPSPGASRAPAPVLDAWPGCLRVGAFAQTHGGGDGPSETGGVPAGFTPTSAVLCEGGSQTKPNGDTVDVDLERTSTEVGPLLTYLAQPDGLPTEEACPAVGFVSPWLFLLDDQGRYVAPAIPRDGCHLPLDDASGGRTWTRLRWTDRVVREGDVTESGEAARTGCGASYKSPVPELGSDPEATGRPLGSTGFRGKTLRVCVWTIEGDQNSYDVVVGTFRSGRSVENGNQASLVAALESAPAGPTGCRKHATSFATVEPVDGGARTVWVELDGCRRVVHDGHPARIAVAGSRLLSLLNG